MKLPLSTNRVVDVIIRALRYGGFLYPINDGDAIRNVDTDATEADMALVAQTLMYGRVSGRSYPRWVTVPLKNGIPKEGEEAYFEEKTNLGPGGGTRVYGWRADSSTSDINMLFPIPKKLYYPATQITGARIKTGNAGTASRVLLIKQPNFTVPKTNLPVSSPSGTIKTGAFPGVNAYAVASVQFPAPIVLLEDNDYYILWSMSSSTGTYDLMSIQVQVEDT